MFGMDSNHIYLNPKSNNSFICTKLFNVGSRAEVTTETWKQFQYVFLRFDLQTIAFARMYCIVVYNSSLAKYSSKSTWGSCQQEIHLHIVRFQAFLADDGIFGQFFG